jgi:hypothetical protein
VAKEEVSERVKTRKVKEKEKSTAKVSPFATISLIPAAATMEQSAGSRMTLSLKLEDKLLSRKDNRRRAHLHSRTSRVQA